MFSYQNRGFAWDVGYEFWGHSCENICLSDCFNDRLADETWALKGDAQMYGFNVISENAPIALAATQSDATIHGGTNAGDPTNPNIDNAELVTSPNTLASAPGGSDQINTSIQPVILESGDRDMRGIRAITHKVFTHFNYAWEEDEYWSPFVGAGVSAEFASNNNCATSCCDTTTESCDSSCSCSSSSCNCTSSCSKSVSCALDQWSIWIKAGLSFD